MFHCASASDALKNTLTYLLNHFYRHFWSPKQYIFLKPIQWNISEMFTYFYCQLQITVDSRENYHKSCLEFLKGK